MGHTDELSEKEHKRRPSDSQTERAQTKKREDREWVPVILKRSDESRRHPDDTLEHTIQEGLEQLNRQTLSLFISAIAAGLILGFSVMAVGIVQSYFSDPEALLLERFLTALVYPLGFVVCVMSGAELFTEHTATAVYPVLDRRSSVPRLLRLWGLVLGGNLVGAYCSAVLLISVDEVVHASKGYMAIGIHLLEYGNATLFASALLAGWLMAQGAWLVMATPPALTQVVCIYLVTFLIGLGPLHHAIAGSVEMFVAWMISDEITLAESLRFIGMAVFGNLFGGSCFVALLNYAHVRRTRKVVKEGEREAG